jgi:hypothetical protein
MSKHNAADYSFEGLCQGKSQAKVNSLIYVVGLVDSINNKAASLRWVNANLSPIYDVEEQIEDAPDLLSWQREILPAGYYPQTPCMLTRAWSPIGTMLDQGFEPIVLRRDAEGPACATGIWESFSFQSTSRIDDAENFEHLFWAILSETFRRAKERKMLVSIIAKPGGSYKMGSGSLPKWSEDEIAEADKILWKRVPED